MINTFEEKLAYEIGVKLAQQDYLEKEASWQAVKALGSGLKGVATGQGATMSQAFKAGAGGQGFKSVAKDIGKGLAKPWQQMYQTYGARSAYRGQKNLNAARRTAQENLKKVQNTQGATKEQLTAAQKAVTDATAASRAGAQNIRNQYGSLQNFNAARNQSYIPRTAEGAVNWGQVGTMAAGAGLAGTGAYMAGNAAFGGGDTYVNKVQPQVAPHQYYMNQLSNYFK